MGSCPMKKKEKSASNDNFIYINLLIISQFSPVFLPAGRAVNKFNPFMLKRLTFLRQVWFEVAL